MGKLVSFRDFMERKVREYYSYEKEKFGGGGDFFTAPELDRAFGEAIADFLMPYLADLENPSLVELGAGRGLMARDILNFYREKNPGLFEKIKYYIYELSGPLKETQKRILKEFPQVEWVEEIPFVEGVVLSNEFFDCLPVHVVKGGKELFVDEDSREVWIDLRDERVRGIIERLGYSNLDQIVEICVDCVDMLEEISKKIIKGYHLVIDYGYTSEEIHKFPEGTVIGYKKHKVVDDVLGKERLDVSAQVNFSLLMEFGRDFGLEPVVFDSQRNFLASIPSFLSTLEELSFREDPESIERLSRLKTMLISMGDRFKVLFQKKVT